MNSILKYMRYFLAFLLLSLFVSTTIQASVSIASSSIGSTSVDLHLDGTIKKISGNLEDNATCEQNDKFLLGTTDESSTGQRISLILTVEDSSNEAHKLPLAGASEDPGAPPRPCIGVKDVNGDKVLEFALRKIYDNTATVPVSPKAFVSISLQAVEKNNNNINVNLDGVHFKVYDLDRAVDNTNTDDFYFNGEPQDLPHGSELNITDVSGRNDAYGYHWKIKGIDRGCKDRDPVERLTCEGGGYIVNSGKVEFRVENKNAFGTYAHSDNAYKLIYRLFQISFIDGSIPSRGIDHGDAPQSYEDASSNIGPAGTYSLGDIDLTDGEEPQHSDNADADDENTNGTDDEDGVSIIGKSIVGSTFTLTKGYKYKFNITTNANGYLNAWMDHNANGTFDGGEHFLSHATDANNSTNIIEVTIPQTATEGTTYMRFRYGDHDFTDPTKRSPGFGEVEDYKVIIQKSGAVDGTVYNDKNGNGTQDAGEEGIAGVKVFIKAANDENQTTTTNNSGEYHFEGVALGNATVTLTENTVLTHAIKTTGTTNPSTVTVVEGDNFEENNGYQYQANLVTTKTVNNAAPQVGETITYTLTVKNNGPVNATGVFLIDNLPSGVTLQSANTVTGTYDQSTGKWEIGTLPASDQNVTLELVATVDATSGNQVITNTTTAAESPDTGDLTNVGDDLSASIDVGAVPGLTISNATVTEGETLRFTVTFAQASNLITKIKFNTVDGTGDTGAISPGDYTPLLNHEVTIPAGTTEVIVEVPTEDDTRVELTETFTIEGNVTEGQTANTDISAIGTILDNEVPAAVENITSDTVNEGEVLSHVVTINAPASTAKTYDFSFENDGDINASDYSFAECVENDDVTCDINAGTITVKPGVTTFTIKVQSHTDPIYEGEESYTVKVGNKEATGTIRDLTEPKIASISDANATEGQVLTHTVTMSGASSSIGEFLFEIEDRETTAGEDYSTDYNFTNGVTYDGTRITVPEGVITFDVNVSSKPDDISEGTETYRIKIEDKTAIGTIIDTGTPTVSISSPRITEGNLLVFDVNLSMKSTESIYLLFSAKESSTAQPSRDYKSFTGANWVEISPNTLGSEFTIETINDEIKEDVEEYIDLTANVVWGQTSNEFVNVRGTILDNDNDIGVGSIENDNALEGEKLYHRVTMSGISDLEEHYDFNIENLTTSDDDYNATPTFSQNVTYDGGQITVPRDTSEFYVIIQSIADSEYEPDPENYKLSIEDKEANGTIKEYIHPSVLRNDNIYRLLAENGSAGIDINILANDDSGINILTIDLNSSVPGTIATDTDNDGDIDKLEVPNEGTWTINDEGVLNFTYSRLLYEHEYSPITYKTKDNRYNLDPATVVVTSLDIFDL